MPRSQFEAILQGRCPRCREGKMFPTAAYNLKSFAKMNEKCPVCNLRFEVEPGFFFGAMYINYAFSVAIFIAIGLALTLLGNFDVLTYIITIVGVTLALLPLLFRYSRILFLHAFGGISFDPKWSK